MMGNFGIWINGEAVSQIRLEIKMQKLFKRIMDLMIEEDAIESIALTIKSLSLIPYDHLREQVVDRLLVEIEKLGEKNGSQV